MSSFIIGFNTTKGDMVRSILYPKPLNFKLHRDVRWFFIFLSFLAIIGLIYAVTIYVERKVCSNRLLDCYPLNYCTDVKPSCQPDICFLDSRLLGRCPINAERVILCSNKPHSQGYNNPQMSVYLYMSRWNNRGIVQFRVLRKDAPTLLVKRNTCIFKNQHVRKVDGYLFKLKLQCTMLPTATIQKIACLFLLHHNYVTMVLENQHHILFSWSMNYTEGC